MTKDMYMAYFTTTCAIYIVNFIFCFYMNHIIVAPTRTWRIIGGITEDLAYI